MRARTVFHSSKPGGSTIAVMPDDTLRYRYTFANGDGRCEFSLLSEVGAPWVPEFQRMIREHGLTVAYGVDLDKAPWCADRLVSNAGA